LLNRTSVYLAAVARRVKVATVLLAAVTGVVLAGCGSPAPASRAAEQRALLADGGGAVVRLGLVPQLPDTVGLVGVDLGLFQRDVGSGVRLQVVRFGSVAEEGQALAAGQLDAAYLDPVTAVRLWQDSHGTRLLVVAGATVGRTGENDSAVLVFTRAMLIDRPAQARGLLEGDVQTVAELDGDPAAARAAVSQELTVLGASIPIKTLAEEFTQVSFSDDPMAVTMLAQARQAAAAGQLKPVTGLAGLFDLGPLDLLLKGAGQRQVSS
jgi:ABC-type nitrate/sulfonate/bicarbonate transport system substrate-binding protein